MAVGLTEELGGAPIPGPVVTTSVPRPAASFRPRPPPGPARAATQVTEVPRRTRVDGLLPVHCRVRPHARAPEPVRERLHHGFPAAPPVRRALAGHHPAAAGRVLPASGGRAEQIGR